MAFEYKEEYKYLSSACLNLTDACNLMCIYCFVEQHPHYMTLDTAKQAVDFLIGNLRYKKEHFGINQDEKSSITYFGGEPTMMYDEIIVPLTLYLEENYPNEYNLNITTNGTLLNQERINFFKEHNIYPLLSIDGIPDTQNINRPCRDCTKSSFDLVYPNITPLLEAFPQTTFRGTIHQSTVQYTFENYIFATYIGFKNIFLMPNGREAWSKEAKEELYNQFAKIYSFMEDCFENNITPISFGPINESFEKVLKHDIKVLQNITDTSKHSVHRCGLATAHGSIGYDGSIYGCQEQPSRDENNIFYIGDIYSGININAHKKLLSKFSEETIVQCENPDLCINCDLKNICGNINCPSTSWDLFKDFRIDNEIHCLWFKYMFSLSVQMMENLTEKNNLLFKEYLDNFCNFSHYFKEGGNS